jgi:hypothetical protein
MILVKQFQGPRTTSQRRSASKLEGVTFGMTGPLLAKQRRDCPCIGMTQAGHGAQYSEQSAKTIPRAADWTRFEPFSDTRSWRRMKRGVDAKGGEPPFAASAKRPLKSVKAIFEGPRGCTPRTALEGRRGRALARAHPVNQTDGRPPRPRGWRPSPRKSIDIANSPPKHPPLPGIALWARLDPSSATQFSTGRRFDGPFR